MTLKSDSSQYDATYRQIIAQIGEAEKILARANRADLSGFERKIEAEKFHRTLNTIRSEIKRLETIVIVESRVEEKKPVSATAIAANPGLYEMFNESIFLRQRQLSIEQIESIIERERQLSRYRGGESRVSAFSRLLRKLADGFQVLKKVAA